MKTKNSQVDETENMSGLDLVLDLLIEFLLEYDGSEQELEDSAQPKALDPEDVGLG